MASGEGRGNPILAKFGSEAFLSFVPKKEQHFEFPKKGTLERLFFFLRRREEMHPKRDLAPREKRSKFGEVTGKLIPGKLRPGILRPGRLSPGILSPPD